MERKIVDLLSRFPGMLAAFEALPDYDQRALCDGLRECVLSRGEQDTLGFAHAVGLVPAEGGEG